MYMLLYSWKVAESGDALLCIGSNKPAVSRAVQRPLRMWQQTPGQMVVSGNRMLLGRSHLSAATLLPTAGIALSMIVYCICFRTSADCGRASTADDNELYRFWFGILKFRSDTNK